jgi:hypothetical protein
VDDDERKENMKVSQLIERLSKCDPNALVVLSRDEEGNGYSELASIDAGFKWSKSERELRGPDGYYPAEPKDKPCVVLWP